MWNNQGSLTRHLWNDLELIRILQSKEKTFHVLLLMRSGRKKNCCWKYLPSSTLLRDGGDLSALISTCLITGKRSALQPAGSASLTPAAEAGSGDWQPGLSFPRSKLSQPRDQRGFQMRRWGPAPRGPWTSPTPEVSLPSCPSPREGPCMACLSHMPAQAPNTEPQHQASQQPAHPRLSSDHGPRCLLGTSQL